MDLATYLEALAGRLRTVAGDELLGVYAGGSYALGAYDAGRSDIDVAAVVRSGASSALKDGIVASIRHEALPCPARGLEFVLYRLASVSEPTLGAAFELNLNTGARMEFRADTEPGDIEAFWFPIDRSILSRHGIALAGPPAAEVFAEMRREALLPAVLESLRWHAEAGGTSDDAVLNACRALRFAVDGVWTSKAAAGAWAVARSPEPLVERALGIREGGGNLEASEVRLFLEAIADQVEALRA